METRTTRPSIAGTRLGISSSSTLTIWSSETPRCRSSATIACQTSSRVTGVRTACAAKNPPDKTTETIAVQMGRLLVNRFMLQAFMVSIPLPSEIVDQLQHLICGLYNPRIRLVRALRDDHLNEFIDHADVRLFE